MSKNLPNIDNVETENTHPYKKTEDFIHITDPMVVIDSKGKSTTMFRVENKGEKLLVRVVNGAFIVDDGLRVSCISVKD